MDRTIPVAACATPTILARFVSSDVSVSAGGAVTTGDESAGGEELQAPAIPANKTMTNFTRRGVDMMVFNNGVIR